MLLAAGAALGFRPVALGATAIATETSTSLSTRPVALVTGGTRGVGAGIAKRLAPTHDLVLSALKGLSKEDIVLLRHRLRHACQPRKCTAATKRTVPTRHVNGALAAERLTLMVDKPVVEQRTKIQKRKKRSASLAADEPKKRKKKLEKKVTKQLKKQLKKILKKQLKKKLKKQLKKNLRVI